MLSTLRSATQSIFAKILLLLLVASFAVWGVSGVFVAGAGNATVEFGKTSVSLLDHRLAYDLQVNNLSRQLGQRITREQARSFGIEVEAISAQRAGEMYPLLRTDDLQGAIWIPGDGKANPADLTMSLAKGARNRGVKIVEGLYADSLGPAGSGADTIEGMLLANAEKIVEALR